MCSGMYNDLISHILLVSFFLFVLLACMIVLKSNIDGSIYNKSFLQIIIKKKSNNNSKLKCQHCFKDL